MKKTAAKRSELLKEIQPDLPKSHAPEVKTFSDSRDLFLFPFVNLEDFDIEQWKSFTQVYNLSVLSLLPFA